MKEKGSRNLIAELSLSFGINSSEEKLVASCHISSRHQLIEIGNLQRKKKAPGTLLEVNFFNFFQHFISREFFTNLIKSILDF